MFLQDVISTNTLCEICLPATHELTTPWQPILSVSAYGQMLYIKGRDNELLVSNADRPPQTNNHSQVDEVCNECPHCTSLRPLQIALFANTSVNFLD